MTRAPAEPKETNTFFRSVYVQLALALRGVEAREHTTQYSTGDLPVLYCSPTMEPGVR